MEEKIIVAFKDNRKDLMMARRNKDYEEELFCEGYEQALCYVLSLLGIGYDEAMSR